MFWSQQRPRHDAVATKRRVLGRHHDDDLRLLRFPAGPDHRGPRGPNVRVPRLQPGLHHCGVHVQSHGAGDLVYAELRRRDAHGGNLHVIFRRARGGVVLLVLGELSFGKVAERGSDRQRFPDASALGKALDKALGSSQSVAVSGAGAGAVGGACVRTDICAHAAPIDAADAATDFAAHGPAHTQTHFGTNAATDGRADSGPHQRPDTLAVDRLSLWLCTDSHRLLPRRR
mmetsp:Transcript_30993/g.95915  ORF Transcript_30993/g.95915 Transcript_30993/m.95915 type:complete len:230 (-) Transcript_30993:538-1227(-)